MGKLRIHEHMCTHVCEQARDTCSVHATLTTQNTLAHTPALAQARLCDGASISLPWKLLL